MFQKNICIHKYKWIHYVYIWNIIYDVKCKNKYMKYISHDFKYTNEKVVNMWQPNDKILIVKSQYYQNSSFYMFMY